MADEKRFRRGGELIVGRLVAHGAANYEFRGDQAASYYLKLLTNRGERVIWGKGLQSALERSPAKPKVGDVIGAQRTGRQAVQVSAQGFGAQKKFKTIWEIDAPAVFVSRARRARLVRDGQTDAKEAVRAHPELKSTFLSLRSAEELAAQRIANPEDREKFLSLVREAIAGSIKRGEPLPEVRLRDRDKESPPAPPVPKVDDPTR
jgi:putative DNA primase/helicase